MIVMLVSMDSYDKEFLEKNDLEIHYEIPNRDILVQNLENRGISGFLHGRLKFENF